MQPDSGAADARRIANPIKPIRDIGFRGPRQHIDHR